MTKLTRKQQEQLNELNQYGTLYVGDNAPQIKTTFDALTRKGYATAVRMGSMTRYSVSSR